MSAIRLSNDEAKKGLELLSNLVSIDSTSPDGSKYEDIIHILKEFYSDAGLSYEVIIVPEEYRKWHCPQASSSPRYIFRGWIGDKKSREWLHFNGHYDVVPGGPGWTITEPFKPIIIDDKVYGRGTTDMKGGLVSMTLALMVLSKYEEKINGFIDAVYVPDEEIGGACGTGFFVDKLGDRLPTYVIIAEPSTLKNIYIGHKGGLWAKVKIRGRTAHASTPWLGDNAFLHGVKIASWLEENYVKTLFSRKSKYAYDEPNGNIPTAMIGGEAGVPNGKSNQVPGEFYFTIDRRIIVEERLEDVENELRQVVYEAARLYGLVEKVEIDIVSMVKPAFVPPDNPISRSIKKTAVSLGLQEPRDVICVGGLDLRYYTDRGVTAVSYGPGVPGVAHAPDEYVLFTDIIKASEIYANLPFRLFENSNIIQK